MADPISNMLTKIRNAQAARHDSVVIPYSRFKKDIAKVLQQRGFLGKIEEKEQEGKKVLVVELLYHTPSRTVQEPAIREICQISKQGRRVYVGFRDIPVVKNGLGVAVISTPQGVLTGEEARKRHVGGEFICTVW